MNKLYKKINNKSGETLVEIMISFLVFTVFATTISVMLLTAVRLNSKSSGDSRLNDEAYEALALMQDETASGNNVGKNDSEVNATISFEIANLDINEDGNKNEKFEVSEEIEVDVFMSESMIAFYPKGS